MKMVTSCVYPPIPWRQFDWCAYDDDSYDGTPGSSPMGWGETKEAAIADFWQQIEEKEEQ